jgi:hypothetical protein
MKKGAAKGAPVRGWSSGTGLGGSNEMVKKDKDLQQRARARAGAGRLLHHASVLARNMPNLIRLIGLTLYSKYRNVFNNLSPLPSSVTFRLNTLCRQNLHVWPRFLFSLPAHTKIAIDETDEIAETT